MPEKIKSYEDPEELSVLLDEMNAGRQPQCDNAETIELLAVADLIKKTGRPICPPQHLLDQTVDRALAGLQAGKPRPSRVWWHSGALGTAAAVILVVGINLLPSWPKQLPPSVPIQSAISQPPDTPITKPGVEPPLVSHVTQIERPTLSTEPTTVSQSPPDEGPKPTDTAPIAKNQIPASEPQKPSSAPAQIPPSESLRRTDTAKIMAEKLPQTTQSKSDYSLNVSKSSSPVIAPLTIPGKVPDLVIIDNDALRQIYYKGTPQEITITQRLLPRGTGNMQFKSQSPTRIEAPDDNPTINSTLVQVTIADQEVTIEGRQTRQELLKLAESLTY